MVHPKPASPKREAFYGYMLGRSHDANALPKLVMQFEEFKASAASEVPDLPFMLLSALTISQSNWVSIAKNASWQTTRMNLNTFARHGVFEAPGPASVIAARLRDAGEIERSRVFPYQLLTAYRNFDAVVPEEVRDALQDAMELGKLSSTLVASCERLRRMLEELHSNLQVPGSSPGCAPRGAR
jgi:60 kDa SS-A/Ro ribonucleoprotein